MSLPVLTAVCDPRREADLAATLSRPEVGVQVVRRCVDLADLLAAAAAGLARAVVLSADLRRLDREALGKLTAAGVAIVGVVAAADDAAEQRLRQLGVTSVLTYDSPADTVSAAVRQAVGAVATEPPASAAAPTVPATDVVAAGTGRVVAVWGPAGAPGRSSIAVNLAAELAADGHPALLVDADSYGGAVASLLGILDEAPGVAAACRLANAGSLDLPRLASAALELTPGLRVLTGIARPERWLELRPAALTATLQLARSLAAYVVVDCGFCLEQDEELAYDTAAPRRNGATLAALAAADRLLTVAACDPIGIARYVRALPDARAAAPDAALVTVANRLRRGAVGPGEPRRQVAEALDRFAGVTEVHTVPEDREALDAALAAGHSLLEAAPGSPARLAIRDLARRLAGGRRGRR